MAHHALKHGLDIPIAGAPATPEVLSLDLPATVGVDPREFRGFTPRLAVREGDAVLAGQPLLYDKFQPDVKIVSPVAGTVKEVRRGARRVIEQVVIEVGAGDAVAGRAWSASELAGISREDARTQLLASGGWVFVRTRPLDFVPSPDVVPQHVLISATETGPLMPGAEVLLSADDREALQAAVHVFKALTDGTVFLTLPEGAAGSHGALSGLEGVIVEHFSGPHPAGDAGVQVNHVCPPRGQKGRVWTVKAWDAVAIGRAFLTGRFDAASTYAVVGTGVQQPRYVRTVLGASIGALAAAAGGLTPGDVRLVRGSVLTGVKTSAEGFAGWLTRGVHAVPERVERRLLGWMMPQLDLWSFHRAFVKGFGKASAAFDLRPGVYGGHRAIVPTGAYEKVVVTPDIQPSFLFKSIIAGDLETSIQLGLLDLTEEEAALCSFVCPSKIDFDVILREGLELYAKEN